MKIHSITSKTMITRGVVIKYKVSIKSVIEKPRHHSRGEGEEVDL